MSDPLVPTALRRRNAQTVKDRSSSYKIDYVIVIKNFLKGPTIKKFMPLVVIIDAPDALRNFDIW